MRIMQIIPTLNLAGAEKMCCHLSLELCSQGHEVIVVCFFRMQSAIVQQLQTSGIRLVFLDKRPGFDFSMFSKLKNILRVEKPDVVHTHLGVLQYILPAYCKEKSLVKVHTIHNIAKKENGFLARKIQYLLFCFYGVIPVALSNLVQQTIAKEYHIKEEKIPVILNGSDLTRCIPKKEYTKKDSFTFLHIGRFAPAKNHLAMLRAFKIVHERYPDTELHLIGVGELQEEAKEKTGELNLNESVKFLGLQDNVYEFLHHADAFLLPSLYEGIPVTLIEAMGTGLPIVATPVGGVPDMIKHEKSGLFCDTQPESIALQMERCYLDATLREKIGKRAKKDSKIFSAETMAKKYLDVYSTIENN